MRSALSAALLVAALGCAPGVPYPPRLDSDERVLGISDDGQIGELPPEEQEALLRGADYARIRAGDRLQLAFRFDPPRTVTDRDYRIEQGDILQILFVDNWAYNSFVTVRPDGMVSPTGLRDVRAGGRTIDEVRVELDRLYTKAGVLDAPGVTVSVNFTDAGFPGRFGGDLLVQDDGAAVHPLLGRFEVAGRTTPEVEQEAIRRIDERFANPVSATVTLVPDGGRFVFLGGEVENQGRIDFTRRLTLSQVVFSGGMKDTADLRRVVLMRGAGEGRIRSYVVNLVRNFEPGSSRRASDAAEATAFERTGVFDVPVRPDDVVYVPKTTVARMNQFVDEWLNKMIPFAKSISYSYGVFTTP